MKKNFSRLILAVSVTACSFMLFAVNASAAYIDPAVVTTAASAIGGIVVACGAFLLIWWRKVKHKVSDKLGIDENANKEVEGDVEITIDEEAPAEEAPAAEASAETVEEAPAEEEKAE